jgi:hypothetical protein
MSEVSKNAAILIATSFQALNRAKTGDKSTALCNYTVTVLFAGFFIEESLDVIIKKMNVKREMNKFLEIKGNKHPSLEHKLAWYFNRYIANPKSNNRGMLLTSKLEGRLNKRFPGFGRIYQIRNDVAHGKINRRLTLKETEKLRLQAKSIVDDFLLIAADNGCNIPRDITYYMATADHNEKLSEDQN